MYLICDWDDEVAHYNLPPHHRDEFKKICELSGLDLLFCRRQEQWPDLDRIVAYVGNRPEPEILHSNSLRWIHFGSVGTDRISSTEASKKGVVITNARGIFDDAVATHIVSRILNRLIPRIEVTSLSSFDRISWETLSNKTESCLVHVLGNGPIAQRLCALLSCLNLRVKAYTKNPSKYDQAYDVLPIDQEPKDHNGENIVINLLPSTEGTSNLVSEYFLSRFSSIYYYLNVGRSQTESLIGIINLMRSDRIKYAGWDVIRDKAICLTLAQEFGQRVEFTPHIAAFSSDHWRRSFSLLLYNMKCFLEGDFKSMENRVNA